MRVEVVLLHTHIHCWRNKLYRQTTLETKIGKTLFGNY